MDYTMLVNKENPLDKDYVPDNLVIYPEYNGIKIDANHKTMVDAKMLEAFFKMKEEGRKYDYDILIDSGYRSYQYQQKVLESKLEELGEVAYSIVALPGTSEHQTGLAFDIAFNVNGEYTDKFDENFEALRWVTDNCYLFGFILRYPKGKEEITGFKHECWHFRYVGTDLALKMHNENIETLEEYHQRKKLSKQKRKTFMK